MVEPRCECPGITMTGPLQASTQFAAAVKKVNRMLEIVSVGLKQKTTIVHEMNLCTKFVWQSRS